LRINWGVDIRTIARSDRDVFRIRDFDEPYAKQDFARFESNGVILRIAHGHYMLVPERHRKPEPDWRPSIERVAIGIARAQFGPDLVALVGASAARVHGALPRALAIATVSYPSTRPRDIDTVVGTVRTYRRSVEQMDVVRMNTAIASGLVTSIEMTMLDLAARAPKWPLHESDQREAIRMLAARADWTLAEQIAGEFRRRSAFDRVRSDQVDADK